MSIHERQTPNIISALRSADLADQQQAAQVDAKHRLFERGQEVYRGASVAFSIFPRINHDTTRTRGLGSGRHIVIGFREEAAVVQASVKATVQEGDTSAIVWIGNDLAIPFKARGRISEDEWGIVGQLANSGVERVLYRLGNRGDIRSADGKLLGPAGYESVATIIEAIDAAARTNLEDFRAEVILTAQSLMAQYGTPQAGGRILATPPSVSTVIKTRTQWLRQGVSQSPVAADEPVEVVGKQTFANVSQPTPRVWYRIKEDGVYRDTEGEKNGEKKVVKEPISEKIHGVIGYSDLYDVNDILEDLEADYDKKPRVPKRNKLASIGMSFRPTWGELCPDSEETSQDSDGIIVMSRREIIRAMNRSARKTAGCTATQLWSRIKAGEFRGTALADGMVMQRALLGVPTFHTD